VFHREALLRENLKGSPLFGRAVIAVSPAPQPPSGAW